MNNPIILDGKKLSSKLYAEIPNQGNKVLAIITIGSDPASEVYVRKKREACEKVGLLGINYKFIPGNFEDSRQLIKAIKELLHDLNSNDQVVGIMIQRPYPKELSECNLEDLIRPNKDVDGLSTYNMFKTLSCKTPKHYPATPKGIITLLDYYNIPIEGKNVVIINRSDIVGKPLAAMLTARNATVTVCHSKTKNLRDYTRMANIIISAVGKPKYLDSSYITTTYPDHAGHPHEISLRFPVIIDVGTCRDENGKLCGDVNYESVLPYVGAITPNPGGVGPMTVVSLILNCINESI